MLYVEFNEIREKFYYAQRVYNELIDEKEAMFARTQPQAVRFDKERVSGSSGNNVFEEYVIAKERSRIDERIAEQKTILEDRKSVCGKRRHGPPEISQ